MNNFSRILSGMRPTGRLHLGHYHGAIKNWVTLQYEHDCYFMVADIHALTDEEFCAAHLVCLQSL